MFSCFVRAIISKRAREFSEACFRNGTQSAVNFLSTFGLGDSAQ